MVDVFNVEWIPNDGNPFFIINFLMIHFEFSAWFIIVPLIIVVINSLIVDVVDKKTKFKESRFNNSEILLLLFFGVFILFFFKKNMRGYRTKTHYENIVGKYDSLMRFNLYDKRDLPDDYYQAKRYLKMEKIKQNILKRKIIFWK